MGLVNFSPRLAVPRGPRDTQQTSSLFNFLGLLLSRRLFTMCTVGIRWKLFNYFLTFTIHESVNGRQYDI